MYGQLWNNLLHHWAFLLKIALEIERSIVEIDMILLSGIFRYCQDKYQDHNMFIFSENLLLHF